MNTSFAIAKSYNYAYQTHEFPKEKLTSSEMKSSTRKQFNSLSKLNRHTSSQHLKEKSKAGKLRPLQKKERKYSDCLAFIAKDEGGNKIKKTLSKSISLTKPNEGKKEQNIPCDKYLALVQAAQNKLKYVGGLEGWPSFDFRVYKHPDISRNLKYGYDDDGYYFCVFSKNQIKKIKISQSPIDKDKYHSPKWRFGHYIYSSSKGNNKGYKKIDVAYIFTAYEPYKGAFNDPSLKDLWAICYISSRKNNS